MLGNAQQGRAVSYHGVSARLRQAAALGAVLLSAYLSIATSCVPSSWDSEIEESVSLVGRDTTRLRLDAVVDGAIREVHLRTEPPVVIEGIELVGLPLDAAVPSVAVPATSASTADSVDVLSSALAPAASASIAVPQPDGSVVINCDGNELCAGIEFSVSRGANAAVGAVRVFADVRGGALTCSGAAPSSIELKLSEQVGTIP